MTGKSHKAIGTAAGIALFLYGWRSGYYEFAPALITAPMGAMLPDIDHNQSKLGNARSKIVKIAIPLTVAGFIGYLGYIYGKTDDIFAIISTLLWVLIPALTLAVLSNIDAVHNALHFASKHRGIMHTLILPLLFFAGFMFLNEPILKYAILGLCIGFLSHLLADCLTQKGCPVLFPITVKNVRFTKIKTGSAIEHTVMAVVCVVLIAAAFIVPVSSK